LAGIGVDHLQQGRLDLFHGNAHWFSLLRTRKSKPIAPGPPCAAIKPPLHKASLWLQWSNYCAQGPVADRMPLFHGSFLAAFLLFRRARALTYLHRPYRQ
ncbi:hypothetical protein, partial [Herbaspirillum sp.]